MPGAGRDAIDGVVDGMLRARVAARPIDGAANRALCLLLAAELGVAPSRVTIVSGKSGRAKVLEVADLEPGAIRSRWPGIEV